MNKNRFRLLRTAAAVALFAAAFGRVGFASAAGPAPDSVPGRPNLVVSSATAVPRANDPDSFPRSFDAKITVKNTGWVIAYRAMLTIPANDYVGVENGSGSIGLGYIYAGRTKDILVPMFLDKADENGRVQPVFHLEYWDDEGRKYDYDEPVRLEFGGEGWNHPLLIVDSNHTVPENPAPGEECALTLHLSNMSNGEARQVMVRLGGDEGPKPFVTVGTSNVGFAKTVPANGGVDVVFPLQVEGAAEPGVYPIPVSLSFRNIIGESLTDSVVVYLKVRTLPSLQAGFLQPPPAPILAGQPFDLSLEVINSGLQTLNVGMVELVSDTLEVSNGSVYSGPLDASTSTSLSATVMAAQAGPADLKVVVHYTDEYNQPQVWSQVFPLQIQAEPATAEPASAEEDGGSPLDQIWKGILAFLGFGG